MSVTASAWAWQQKTGSPGRKAVLMALADNANDDGVCWPGQKQIAAKAEMTERAVRDNLRALVDAGLLRVEQRRRGDGTKTSNLYVLAMRPPEDSSGGQEEAGFRHQRKQASGHEPSVEPSEGATPLARAREAADAVAEVFDYWRDRCNHPAAKLTGDRKAKVKARLREDFTVADIRKGIDGAAKHPYIDERGKRHDGLELICRSGSKLEDFMDRADLPAAAPPTSRPGRGQPTPPPSGRGSSSRLVDAFSRAKGAA